MAEDTQLSSKTWLNDYHYQSASEDDLYRWTLVITLDRNEFIDDHLEAEYNVPHIIEHFCRSYHEELQTNDKQPTINLIAQTVIERAALEIRKWKKNGRPEKGFRTAHLTLVPLIAAMFRLDGEQNYYFKKAMRWLSCAPLGLHLELLRAIPDMPFELILHQ